MIFPNGVNTFDGSWFSALIAVESEIPTFTTPLATSYSKIAVELHFQDSVWAFFNEDTILQQRDHFTWALQQSVNEQKRLDVHRNNENKPLSTHNFRRLPRRLPRALFPVPLRNYSSRTLISLGAFFPWCSCGTLITLRSYRAGRSLFTRWPFDPLAPSLP